MQSSEIIWGLTLAMTLIAALTDWRSHRIPNWLTVPALLLGVAVHTQLSGWHGTLFALEGASLALLLLLAPVLTRGLGAAHWKLMVPLRAFPHPVLFFVV